MLTGGVHQKANCVVLVLALILLKIVGGSGTVGRIAKVNVKLESTAKPKGLEVTVKLQV